MAVAAADAATENLRRFLKDMRDITFYPCVDSVGGEILRTICGSCEHAATASAQLSRESNEFLSGL